MLAADFHFGEDGARGCVIDGIAGDPLVADYDEERHFKAGDAVETAAAIDDGLHKSALFDTDGLQGFFEFSQESLVGSGFFGRQKHVRPVSPVLTAFKETLAFLSGLVGPVLCWALARLAASWASERVDFSDASDWAACCSTARR